MCIMATVRGGSSIIELQELLRCQHLSQLSNLSNFTTQLSSNQIKTGSCLLTHSLTQSRFSIGVKEHVWAKLTDFIQVSHKQCVIHGFHFVGQRIAENEPHISGGGGGGGEADLDVIQSYSLHRTQFRQNQTSSAWVT